MSDLEATLYGTCVELGIKSREQSKLIRHLETIREKDEETYKHSIRVAVLLARMAQVLGIDPVPLFYSGAYHDYGKVSIDKEVLAKKGTFSEEDREKMKKHPLEAYRLLKRIIEFTAEIVVRHHLWQKNPYPERLPEECNSYPLRERIRIEYYARLLSIADFYDAITTRDNAKFGEKRLTPKERKAIILENYPDQREIIERLYAAQVFDNVADDSGCQKDL